MKKLAESAASAASPEGFGSRDQVGCQRSLPDCLHGERPVPAFRMPSRRPGDPQAIGEAALAPDLITANSAQIGKKTMINKGAYSFCMVSP